MIVASGFDGLSMQKLAKAAGVSPATIYIYFNHREDLIIQLGAEASNKMTEVTLRGFDPGMSFKDGLRVQWKNRAEFCMKYPKEMHFLEQIRHSPFDKKVNKLLDKRFLTQMGEFVGNAIRNKELAPLEHELFWSLAFAPLYILVQFHMSKSPFNTGKNFKLTEEIMEKALERVLLSLRP